MSKYKIPFNKPYITGRESKYIQEALDSRKLSGDGSFTIKCQNFFERRYNFKKCLLTTSCTDALEMAAILLDICEGDEVISPSYTFVSTVNAFVLRGAKIVFVDSEKGTPNIDSKKIESLITPRTKAIIVVHYAGIACDMESIMSIANANNLFVVEDAAQSVDSYYKGIPLGSIGHIAAFSFHETKNIICGEGGMLVVNDDRFVVRSEIIREKGTNRSKFLRGEVDKYSWVDIGSSFLPSDINAAFLYAQLEALDKIQDKRKLLWRRYYDGLKLLQDGGLLSLPNIPQNVTANAHMFYIVCNSIEDRSNLIEWLGKNGVHAVFHYLSLHASEFYAGKCVGVVLSNSDRYSDCLLRLPLFFELEESQVDFIVNLIIIFFKTYKNVN